MTDLHLTAMWACALGAGLAGALVVRGVGLATTYVRDLLHVGAGVWVVGWLWWNDVAAPMAIVGAVAVAIALVPAVAPHVDAVARFRRTVSDRDERFGGLIVYTLSFVVMTWLGLTRDPFPAAAALLSLSLGDGIGGAVGRQLGRRFYATPFGKRKSLEGTAAVAIAAAIGVTIAAELFGVELAAWRIAVLGVVAAAAEGIAPRSSDNALVPAAVCAAAELLT